MFEIAIPEPNEIEPAAPAVVAEFVPVINSAEARAAFAEFYDDEPTSNDLSSKDGVLSFGADATYALPRIKRERRASLIGVLIEKRGELRTWFQNEAATSTHPARRQYLAVEVLPHLEKSIYSLLLELRGCVDALESKHITLSEVQALIATRRTLRNEQLEFMRAVDAEAYADQWFCDALALGVERANELRMQRDAAAIEAAAKTRKSTLAQAA